MRHKTPLDAEQETNLLLTTYNFAKCMDIMYYEFGVIQNRTQMLLTLATITLTIAGFSGPKIAQSGPFARYTLISGLVFAMFAIFVTLLGTLKTRWLAQFQGDTEAAKLVAIIRYRNFKTSLYRLEITTLVAGLTLYVASMIAYFFTIQ